MLDICNLTKRYRKTLACDRVSFHLDRHYRRVRYGDHCR